jgi:hypothetical protein
MYISKFVRSQATVFFESIVFFDFEAETEYENSRKHVFKKNKLRL